jgi:galactose mutarotase-like enzyme
MPTGSDIFFKTKNIPDHPIAGPSVLLEGPLGQRALIALQAGSIEQLCFRYPKIDGPVDVIYPHENFLHLITDPTGAGAAVLAPINNRSKGGQMHVVDPGVGTPVETIQLPLNFPKDVPRDSIHGNASKGAMQLLKLSEPNPIKASVVMKYVSSGENRFGTYPEKVEFIFKVSLTKRGLLENLRMANYSDRLVPPSFGRHTSFLPGYVREGQNTPISKLKVRVDAARMLELDPKYNVTGKVIDFDDCGDDPVILQYDLRNGKEVGGAVLDHVYVLSGRKKLRVYNPEKGVGVSMECSTNVDHGTVWSNGDERNFLAMEPGVHAGIYNSPEMAHELGQDCLKPGEYRDFSWNLMPITGLIIKR